MGRECGEEWSGSLGLADANGVYIEWINNKVLLYSTGNYVQYLVITYNGKESEYITESLCCTPGSNTTL